MTSNNENIPDQPDLLNERLSELYNVPRPDEVLSLEPYHSMKHIFPAGSGPHIAMSMYTDEPQTRFHGSALRASLEFGQVIDGAGSEGSTVDQDVIEAAEKTRRGVADRTLTRNSEMSKLYAGCFIESSSERQVHSIAVKLQQRLSTLQPAMGIERWNKALVAAGSEPKNTNDIEQLFMYNFYPKQSSGIGAMLRGVISGKGEEGMQSRALSKAYSLPQVAAILEHHKVNASSATVQAAYAQVLYSFARASALDSAIHTMYLADVLTPVTRKRSDDEIEHINDLVDSYSIDCSSERGRTIGKFTHYTSMLVKPIADQMPEGNKKNALMAQLAELDALNLLVYKQGLVFKEVKGSLETNGIEVQHDEDMASKHNEEIAKLSQIRKPTYDRMPRSPMPSTVGYGFTTKQKTEQQRLAKEARDAERVAEDARIKEQFEVQRKRAEELREEKNAAEAKERAEQASIFENQLLAIESIAAFDNDIRGPWEVSKQEIRKLELSDMWQALVRGIDINGRSKDDAREVIGVIKQLAELTDAYGDNTGLFNYYIDVLNGCVDVSKQNAEGFTEAIQKLGTQDRNKHMALKPELFDPKLSVGRIRNEWSSLAPVIEKYWPNGAKVRKDLFEMLFGEVAFEEFPVLSEAEPEVIDEKPEPISYVPPEPVKQLVVTPVPQPPKQIEMPAEFAENIIEASDNDARANEVKLDTERLRGQFEEIDEVLLPHGSSVEDLKRVIDGTDLSDNDKSKINWQRLHDLVDIRDEYSGKLWLSKKGTLRSNGRYFAVEIVDGDNKFAVAENPVVGNATYLVNEAKADGTWVEVLREHRGDALVFGAERIIHPKRKHSISNLENIRMALAEMMLTAPPFA